MIGYVAAGHKVIPPIGKITGIPGRPRSPDKRPKQARRRRVETQSGYALPTFQPAGILILIDATLAASLSRCSGGSNGARVRLWKVELQKLADETRLVLHVHHYPPGTSKWNKIEHRMFCHITQNWRGRPLTDRLAIVELIGATTTKAGLKVECAVRNSTAKRGDLEDCRACIRAGGHE